MSLVDVKRLASIHWTEYSGRDLELLQNMANEIIEAVAVAVHRAGDFESDGVPAEVFIRGLKAK